jgi:pyruvate dehydrogenase E2 component (dihydrolipoamide acetyltransferase)
VPTIQEVTLPDIGDFAGVEIIEILVAPGDRVEKEQSLLTLESDKATMDIPAPRGGLVTEIKVALGQKLNRGDLILLLEVGEEADDESAVPPLPSPPPPGGRGNSEVGTGAAGGEQPGASADQTAAAGAAALPLSPALPREGGGGKDEEAADYLAQDARSGPASRAPGEVERRLAPVLPRPEELAALAKGRKTHASPGVRRFARELGVDLTLVKGSGLKDRVLKEDVQGYVKQTLTQGAAPSTASSLPFALPTAPEVDFAKFGPVEMRELSRIQKLSGRHLHRAWLSVPHVTQFDEADITELEAFRQMQGAATQAGVAKLTLLPFLLKAVATALNRLPRFKSSLTPDGEGLVMKHYTHIGVAVDTPRGLVVPVVRDVDKKGLQDLARELMELSAKARDGKLLPGDMQGGCFSISSLGGIGGTAFTPIVNAPEVAILGVSRANLKPVWQGTAFVPRLLLPLSLSYDHRVIDGAEGARFTRLLGELLGDIRRLLL